MGAAVGDPQGEAVAACEAPEDAVERELVAAGARELRALCVVEAQGGRRTGMPRRWRQRSTYWVTAMMMPSGGRLWIMRCGGSCVGPSVNGTVDAHDTRWRPQLGLSLDGPLIRVRQPGACEKWAACRCVSNATAGALAPYAVTVASTRHAAHRRIDHGYEGRGGRGPRAISVGAMFAILDGTITDAAEARIPVSDDGFLRGDGVFEVIRLYGGRPFALDDHLARMRN